MIRAHVSAQEGIGSISSDASRPLWCRLGVRAARLESERQSLPDRATTRPQKQTEKQKIVFGEKQGNCSGIQGLGMPEFV